MLGWSIGFFLAGVVYGGMTRRPGGPDGRVPASMIGMLGLVASLYIVASVLRLHGEQTSGRAEPVLANAVGRLRWAAGHLAVAFGGSALLMLLVLAEHSVSNRTDHVHDHPSG
ncbi:hypothetical protein DF19_23805 [Streptomyces olindensis]|nr:hypothetical protein DF19_23805 [Streptomyces olindensis]